MSEYRLPVLAGRILYPQNADCDLDHYLDYKLLVNSQGEVEAIFLLKTFGGPTIWVLIDESNCEKFDELAEILRPGQ